MGKRTIGDPQNKAGLAPCDHARAMKKAWSDERDRLIDDDNRQKAERAYTEMFRWDFEHERLFRDRHGIHDISAGVAIANKGEFIWIGTDSSGERALYRSRDDYDCGAASYIAKHFIGHIVLDDVRATIQRKSRSGESVVSFTLARKREVKIGNLYALEDTGYAETEWRFCAKWSVEVKVDEPLLVDDETRRKSSGR